MDCGGKLGHQECKEDDCMVKGNLLDDAITFAVRAHAGQKRKGSCLPYIVHPLEAAAICASLTDDTEVLAAAVLHDTVEDTGATAEQIEELFGARVASIVAGDSEDKRESLPPEETWKARKVENIGHIASAGDAGVRVVCLGDKLSNVRAIQREYEALGDELWQRFSMFDMSFDEEHIACYCTLIRPADGYMLEHYYVYRGWLK